MSTKLRRKISLHDTRIAGLYDLETTIGKGHFAVVKLARHVFTGEKVAVKIIDKTKLEPVSTNHIMQEVRCMKLVQHPNIVRLYEVIDTQTKLFLILELGDYDMYDFILKHGEEGCKEPIAQQYFSQIIKAIDYCHALHVVHRDLKPENVVFFEKLGMVKLTDFGFSNLFVPGEHLRTSCGSLAYSAPEILLGDSYDAPAVDVWSLGVILYMLVSGKLPFEEANESETLTQILDCRYKRPEGVSDACCDLIAKMLVRDPAKRATLEELTANPWVVAGDRGHAEALPLIAREHLPDEAHTTIIEQMVAGGIGSEQEILSAIENDDYTYLTATYYLLAERVLSTYREEQASRLAAEAVLETELEAAADASFDSNASSPAALPSLQSQTSTPIYRSRSRSNSWRGSAGPARRPCSILKEESEEELSTYLRSSSRQSSRFCSHDRYLLSPRQLSVESESSGASAPATPSLVHTSYSHALGSEHRFVDLSPISELDTTSLINVVATYRRASTTSTEELAQTLTDDAREQRLKAPSGARITRTASAPMSPTARAKFRLLRPPLLRRNSSPSVSMFGLGSGLSASKDRVSPQAIQDLLEVTRLPSGLRRAASPESRISSRSPSPPCSSGRASPSFSLVQRSFLKVTSGTSGPSGLVGLGGMRKLSSSPHLLGICEEGEEGSDGSPCPSAPSEGGNPAPSDTLNIVTRSTRSASTGLATVGGRSALKDSVTYSTVRMICARQAVVSPDLCRRYDQHHKRLLTRTKRSTSCSSSEASDDDSNERRLNLLSMKYCKHSDDRNDDEDPPQAGSTSLGSSRKPTSSTPQISISTETSSGTSKPQNSSSSDALDPSLLIGKLDRLKLHTIMESPSNANHLPNNNSFLRKSEHISQKWRSYKPISRSLRRTLSLDEQSIVLARQRLLEGTARLEEEEDDPPSASFTKSRCSSKEDVLAASNGAKVSELGSRFGSTCLPWPQKNPSVSSNLADIESHWANRLAAVEHIPSGRPPKYILSMFPYPSGRLHMGHMRVYTISDVLARYYRLNGFDVIHPIGWDAFGLPAENAARDHGVDPREWTYANIDAMKDQLKRTGVDFDWNREFLTCDPKFYQWTQWIFCKLFEKGLVRRSMAEVHWDPVDQTVLAAEQIDANGRSWRSGALAERRRLRQWAVETPKYAKELLEGLDKLPEWKEVADIQANWIGKFVAVGVYRIVLFHDTNSDSLLEESFDLRIRDVTELARGEFLIVSADHPLADKNILDQEYCLPNITAMNVITGVQMPIVVSPRVNEGGKESFLNARLGFSDNSEDCALIRQLNLVVTPRRLNLSHDDVVEIAEFGAYGGYQTSRTLVDWVVSRQRKWGTPIPMVISKDGRQATPVPYDRLPLLAEHQGKPFQKSSLAEGAGIVETDTLDTFFDSSWYYLRYLDVNNKSALVDYELTKKLMPVDVYVGGIEHAAIHMFFARFVSYFLNDIGASAVREPFSRLVPQGIVRGKTFIRPDTGEYVKSDLVKPCGNEFVGPNGEMLDVVFEKMSKSKHNGVDPLVVLERDGIDLARLQLLDSAAPRAPINWGDSDLKGLKKWLDRVAWVVNTYVEQRGAAHAESPKFASQETEDKYKESYNYFVRNASMLLEVLHLHNTAIARLQGLTNALRKIHPDDARNSVHFERCVHALVIMTQVFAPHTAAEFWAALCSVPATKDAEWNRSGFVWEQRWPQVDRDADIDFIVTVGEVNCGRIAAPREQVEAASPDELRALAESRYHSSLFHHMKHKGFAVRGYNVQKRDGFHVTLNVSIDEGVDEAEIRAILDTVAKERFKERKSHKKDRKITTTTAHC
ncbi:hypothetical protein QR680_009430 [Steinernema hermaphroditum]|uniref:SNF-related serine/threonine-protein kinase n=1 Tax=Steinernema hermaphroditum TaxID=289476 RepID=A0AA39IK70_9BILA|nr:hypothetical protein QR680_009430 [Steinernema hermaphroditum]